MLAAVAVVQAGSVPAQVFLSQRERITQLPLAQEVVEKALQVALGVLVLIQYFQQLRLTAAAAAVRIHTLALLLT